MNARRLLPLSVLALAACTPSEVAKWVEWYEVDPVAAVEFANLPEIEAELHPVSELRNRHPERWEEIAWCESGRRWDLVATNRTGTYGGGLMIRHNVWRAYGGTEFAPTANLASKAEQIEVAERILDDVGWKAWDCA